MNQISVKYIFNIFSGSTPESGQAFFWDGDHNWFTPDDLGKIGNKIYVDESNRKITDEGVENANLKFGVANSIIITKRAPIGNLAITTLPSSCNQGCFILEQKNSDINVKYYYYYFLIQKDKLNNLGRGSTFLELNADEMKSYKAPLPSLSQQNKIVDYLDNEVAKIDALIEKKTQLVTILEEKKKAVINQTVTKGLDPNVSMKDSGIQWLGYIPKHWELVKLKYVSNLKSGDFLPAENIKEEGDFKVFGGNGARGYFDNYNHEGDLILIGRQGALCGNINFANEKFWATEHAIVCNPIALFDYYWLGKQLELMNLNQYSLAAAQPGLSVDVIKNLFIVFPPINEQRSISNYLLELDKKNGLAVKKIRDSIDLLKEKRTAVISAAVNGELNAILS
ncbi:putative type I restriction-modification system, S subunit [Pedobacter sp. BAL39]|uniref:restriction endonuclease subunit S n=1 Tax=Pedobacter sp. BAL39 TaxID=391596 RepID=UPI000155AB3F|nr:restriction endonuclease subunit S [Pedobacter sp. BAL39]EDM34435.1 putative type I restriction-modification system, S subunit [Pedobacter sp. BAL39]